MLAKIGIYWNIKTIQEKNTKRDMPVERWKGKVERGECGPCAGSFWRTPSAQLGHI